MAFLVFHFVHLCFLPIVSRTELYWCFVLENPSLTTKIFQILPKDNGPSAISRQNYFQCMLCFIIDYLVSMWHQLHIPIFGHNISHNSHTTIKFFLSSGKSNDYVYCSHYCHSVITSWSLLVDKSTITCSAFLSIFKLLNPYKCFVLSLFLPHKLLVLFYKSQCHIVPQEVQCWFPILNRNKNA